MPINAEEIVNTDNTIPAGYRRVDIDNESLRQTDLSSWNEALPDEENYWRPLSYDESEELDGCYDSRLVIIIRKIGE